MGDSPHYVPARKRRCFSTKLVVWPLFSLLCLEKTQSVRGMASKAKIAMYKACWVSGCAKSDMAAAMEKAIEDGVDVLSVSIGSPDFHTPYYSEPIAIAAFAATDRGIYVACSAGNDGPSPSQIVNAAPWITTVSAGSLDSTFPVQLRLGNGKKVYLGDSLYSEEVNVTQMFPIFHLEYCIKSLLTSSHVMGQIVVSKGAGVDDGFLIQEAGGVGLVGLSWKEIGEGTYRSGLPIALAQRRLQRRLGNILLHQHSQRLHCKHHVPSSNSFGETSYPWSRPSLLEAQTPLSRRFSSRTLLLQVSTS